MWRSSFLVNLQACRLIAGNFTNKRTPSQVFFNTVSSPPCSPIYWLKPHSLSNFEELPHVLNTCGKPCYFWKIETTVQSISTRMYYVLFTKILQGSDTTSGTVFQKRCSRICGLNPRLIYLQRVSKILYAGNRTLFHNSCLSKHNKWRFSKGHF